ncbi:MAG: bifunctional demethylmenaquinone methyltransferase/2-methoxy-6-polyprenyl-1,4-benzoquinol methylase UbiE [Gammaproteobacteria bacterium]|nr:bifunctional demethylmenaquinone methyltransferase/2-methoxy-6-polyprenyl-1,4-benzoquinol methylase UbiE [Gammaproteobacteria bacterium]
MGDAPPPESDTDETQFGFERVPTAAKTARVKRVFDAVSPRYDLMNDLMSAGLHRLWKRFAVDLLKLRPGHVVLDLAGGTGDIARLLVKRFPGQNRVLVSDINAQMLWRGRDRALDAGLVDGLEYVQGNAEALPFASNSIDRVTMGFGLRNVTHKDQALAEIARVLRPGGRVAVLEFSAVKTPLLSRAYDFYSFQALPRLGQWVAGDGDSYRYLAESIRVHPDQEALKFMMERAGFEDVRYYNLLAGIVAVHVGWKY